MATSPWLSIPLSDYEGHMGAAEVQQLSALSELFRRAVGLCRPQSIAILGIAGGNGLEHIAQGSLRRIVGVDVNPHYLAEVGRRYHALSGLELHCVDLASDEVHLPAVDFVHAALIFEHAGLLLAVDNAVALVAPGGSLSVVLQLPARDVDIVTPTPFTSMQALRDHVERIDVASFRALLARRGFAPTHEENLSLVGGKAFWLGVFSRLGQ